MQRKSRCFLPRRGMHVGWLTPFSTYCERPYQTTILGGEDPHEGGVFSCRIDPWGWDRSRSLGRFFRQAELGNGSLFATGGGSVLITLGGKGFPSMRSSDGMKGGRLATLGSQSHLRFAVEGCLLGQVWRYPTSQ